MGVLFISHSSKNNDEAIQLRDWLRAEGYSETFLDLDPEHGLAPGQRWEEELQKAGERCSGIVILISPEWAASKWCFHEFKFAKALGKKIFPVLVKTTAFDDMPSELYSHFQLADISSPDLKEDGLTRLRIGLRRAGLDPKSFTWPPEDEPDRAPYRGLQALTEKDAAVFFGRDAQITAGLDKLRQMRSGAPKRILTIAAASGAGKSSFLQAGLLSRLERDTQNFLVLPTARPGRDAMGGEAGILHALGMAEAPQENASLFDSLGAWQAPVIEHLTSLASVANESYDVPPPTLILPIDQAEELFSIDNKTGATAIEFLIRCLSVKTDLALILTIRSDSLGMLQADAEIARQLDLFNLPALPPAAFKEVIEGPGALAQPPLAIDPALTTRLISDLNRSDALPLLAFTMERLATEYGDDHLLELREYTEGLGGVSGAINAAVEAALVRAEADPTLPDNRFDLDLLARKAFIPQLIQLDEADASPKRRVTNLADLPKETRPLIKHFVEERLLVQREHHGQIVVEVSHEAVLRHWRGLSAWIGEERTMLIGLQRIKRSAEEWGGNEKTLSAHSPDLLVHRGERLIAAEAFFDRVDFAKDLEGQPTTYLKACRALEDAAHDEATAQAAREKKQEARGQRWRRLTTAMVFVAVILTAWGLLTTVQGQRTVQQNFATFLNTEAISAIDEGQFERAMRLGILASADSALNPTDSGASFTLGRASMANHARIALSGHSNAVNSAVFSPDGARIVTASLDGTARVWTLASDGQWQSERLEGHSSAVNSAAFSPDGAQVVTVSWDWTVRVWMRDRNGAWQDVLLEGHSDWVNSVAFSSDGTQIVTASEDGTARVWSLASEGAWQSAPLVGHSDSVNSAAFSPDGTQIATASEDGTARVWTQDRDGAWQGTPLEAHSNAVNSAAFSPDGTQIVTASWDGTARVWSWASDGRWQSARLEGHSSVVNSAAFSPDGTHIVTASDDGTARVWTPARDGQWQSARLEGHASVVNSAAFSPDGAQVVTASDDGTVRVWTQARNGRWQSGSLMRHSGPARSAAFSPHGAQIVTASDDGTARVWTLGRDGPWQSARLEGHSARVNSAAFSSNGTQIVTASDDGIARVWTLGEDGAWQSAPLLGHSSRVNSAAFSSDGTQIVTASDDRTARVWTFAGDGQWQSALLGEHSDWVNSAAFSPDGTLIVTASDDRTALVWTQNKDGAWQSTPLEGHSSAVSSAAFSPEGTQIVTGSWDGTARVWTRDRDGAWQSKPLEGHSSQVNSAVFSPDRKQIVTASDDGTARLWTPARDGQWQSSSLEGHAGGVNSAAFSPDGTLIVTASVDGSARVWTQASDSAWQSTPLSGRSDEVHSAAFSPDGTQIVTAADDGTARVWNVTGLLSDASRAFAASRNKKFRFTPIVEQECSTTTHESSTVSNPTGSEDGLRYALAEITQEDIVAVPVLRTIGVEPKDNVCEISEPGTIDAILSAVLPKSWWSGLDY